MIPFATVNNSDTNESVIPISVTIFELSFALSGFEKHPVLTRQSNTSPIISVKIGSVPNDICMSTPLYKIIIYLFHYNIIQRSNGIVKGFFEYFYYLTNPYISIFE